MRFLAGWITGLATAWAALAIWGRTPIDGPSGYTGSTPYDRYRRGEITREEWSATLTLDQIAQP